MPTYLPTPNVTPVFTFIQFSGTVSALQTALQAAFPDQNVQCFPDTTSGKTSNAVVVVNDRHTFSVAPSTYVGYNQGAWAQYTSAQVAGGINSLYTPYTPS